jgi:phage gp45-like
MNPTSSARRLGGRLLRLIGVGRLSVIDDAGDQQRAQVNIGAQGDSDLEEVIDHAPRLGDYGVAYRPPDGSEALMLFLGGRRSTAMILATGHRATRVKNLQPGEVQIYNGLTGKFVKFCADGKIRSSGDWIHTGNFQATGDILDHSDDGKGQTMEASRANFDIHTHATGGPNTGVPNQQEPH